MSVYGFAICMTVVSREGMRPPFTTPEIELQVGEGHTTLMWASELRAVCALSIGAFSLDLNLRL